jgi:hypothetical protein
MKLTTHLHLLPRPNNEWSYTSTPPIRLHGVVLSSKNHRNYFTFTATLHGVRTQKKSIWIFYIYN